MLRVRDPEVSLTFYSKILGMEVLEKFDFDDMHFSLYFLGFSDAVEGTKPAGRSEQIQWMARQSGVLELTHNWGTETDNSFAGYHEGNSSPQGFGHIGISVPDVYAACQRFEQLEVEFLKRPDAGSMKGLAFIKDPDGYWIEIFSPSGLAATIVGG